jgi:hypothetical protein
VKITKETLETELNKAPAWVSALLFALAERLLKADELLSKGQSSDPALLEKIVPALQIQLAQSKRQSA